MSKIAQQALARTNKMQALHSEVMQDIQAIIKTAKALPEIKARVHELEVYYQTHWLEDVEAVKQNVAMNSRQQAIKKGEYSILGEDTLWNTLEQYHEANRALLQAIAKLI